MEGETETESTTTNHGSSRPIWRAIRFNNPVFLLTLVGIASLLSSFDSVGSYYTQWGDIGSAISSIYVSNSSSIALETNSGGSNSSNLYARNYILPTTKEPVNEVLANTTSFEEATAPAPEKSDTPPFEFRESSANKTKRASTPKPNAWDKKDQQSKVTTNEDKKQKGQHWWEAHIEQLAVIYKSFHNHHQTWCQRTVVEEKDSLTSLATAVANGTISSGSIHDTIARLQLLESNNKIKNNSTISSSKMHQYLEDLHKTTSPNPSNGMVLVKMPKAGSSTAAAVALQIAQVVGESNNNDKTNQTTSSSSTITCPHHVHHAQFHVLDTSKQFLWTSVREPSARMVSAYFFTELSRRQQAYNATFLIERLEHAKYYQMRYIQQRVGDLYFVPKGLNESYVTSTKQGKHKKRIFEVAGLFQTFSFVAVTERMDESLVVMKLLFGFSDEAMVVLDSKASGGYDDGQFQNTCHKIIKPNLTQDVIQYISKNNGGNVSFHDDSNYDDLMYMVANRSLDKTIEVLGREKVSKEVERHRQLKRLAQESCGSVAILPCGGNNVTAPNPDHVASCYFGDVGCGHECVMAVVRNATVT